jgi:dTDP-4-dehydrorhamnose 3,5-epimerase
MRVSRTFLPGVKLIEPGVFREERGWLAETWSAPRYADHGLAFEFVQDNVSFSRAGVLRGLHFQQPNAQGKLITVLEGEIWDVAVDVRRDSRTFGRWVAVTLSSYNMRQLWVPQGYAHGFLARAPSVVLYKLTAVYDPSSQRSIAWSDSDLGIPWPHASPVLSRKDARAPRLREIPRDALPAMTRSIAVASSA